MSRIIFNFQINKQIGFLESFLAGKDEGKAEEEEEEEKESDDEEEEEKKKKKKEEEKTKEDDKIK